MISTYLEQVKKEHHKARHWCYAWRLGFSGEQYRINDDGEPSGTAGLPIYGQIQSFELTNVLVIVVRYFGGTKLGVSGLINAYKTTTKACLQEAEIIQKTVDTSFQLIFEYADMDKVLKVIRQFDAQIISRDMALNCDFKIAIRQSQAETLKTAIEELRCVKLKHEH
ncbi:MAG: YigZ family protein [Flavobacteriales bacterium]|nr:MAG: YigZ family protein [Flavobacteriales bacterium]